MDYGLKEHRRVVLGAAALLWGVWLAGRGLGFSGILVIATGAWFCNDDGDAFVCGSVAI